MHAVCGFLRWGPKRSELASDSCTLENTVLLAFEFVLALPRPERLAKRGFNIKDRLRNCIALLLD